MTKRFLVILSLLAGCATTPSPTQRPPVEAIATFAFVGRLAVRQGETRHYMKIDWRHDRAADEILLTTPLGQGVAEITRDAAGARLVLADQRRYAAGDWSELSEKVFGFRLPLETSMRWLFGRIDDTDGWCVTVTERAGDAPDALPLALELERDDIHVRLKIDEWGEVR